jgi:fermentation-respiration switch protein FrsA (DUF1100 family)
MLEIGLSVVKIAAVAYVGIFLLVFFSQSKYVYYPGKTVALTPASGQMNYEDVELKTPDGETLAGWYVPAPTNVLQAPVLLDCHGNAGDIGDRVESVRTFHNLGLNVLIFDYRGYGHSTGKPTEKGTYLDALTAWEYLAKEKGLATNQIIVFGRSLGGSVASWLAERVTPAALVIESSFTSAPDMAKKMFPYLPVRLLCRFKYDTLARVKKIHCPILIAHSRDDEMIPFEHGQRLFAAANEPKVFVEMQGEHNSGGLDVDPDYQRVLSAFISKHVPGYEKEKK